MDPYIIASAMVAIVFFFAGFHAGKKTTIINHTTNYSGDIEKLVLYGEVRMNAPQNKSEGANLQQPTGTGQN
jgi:hypothetical protein